MTVHGAQQAPVGEAFVQNGTSPFVRRLVRWGGVEARSNVRRAGLPYGGDVTKAVAVFGPGDIAGTSSRYRAVAAGTAQTRAARVALRQLGR